MAHRGTALTLLLSLSLFSAPIAHAQAQSETLYDFELRVESGIHVATLGTPATATLTVIDHSRDSPQGLVPGQEGGVLAHYVTFDVTPRNQLGWIPSALGTLATYPGGTYTQELQVQVFPQAKDPYYVARINATMETPTGPIRRSAAVTFFTPGIPGFTVLPGPSIDRLEPLQIHPASFSIYNVATLERSFQAEVAQNDCGLAVGPPATTVVPGHQFQKVEFSIQGPQSRFSPLSDDNCVVGLKVYAQDNPGQALTVILPVKVTGNYIDPLLVFYALAAIALLVLLVLFLRRRKERLEEEILGKPQKPWTIPVEQVYLRHLKAKDPRAWYVVRHYLMEDEYRSSLLWYKAYKRATRGDRKKERLVLAQEKAYARWKAAWEKDLAKPVAKADRFEARLQRKLDRKARKAHRKDLRKWRKQVRKLEARHAKQVEREAKLHDKLVARARKKGLPEPEAPTLAPPALPPQPTLQARPLAQHRWARKAARFRRRMLREQGNLEVRFEKADARRRLRVRRKVERATRDLGDADFVAQHTPHD
ncbi:MAG TPA: hypothetical protein VHI93_04465 [Candidatus Thermoplasmatota archaeon]|nr:hypothetical protein [Candidatus Thermoplasmatota archaeon]